LAPQREDRFPEEGRASLVRRSGDAHREIYAGDDTVEYAFMGEDPTAADNRWLREAMEQQVPVIYFLGFSPARYLPIHPAFVAGWQPQRLRVELTFGAIVGASAQATVPDAPERRYACGHQVEPDAAEMAERYGADIRRSI
jgi:putative restriction endonuclease